MLKVNNIGFSYGNIEILKDVSFNSKENEVISILGPNGTGKTTLLKCICNIHHPNHGTVLVNDENVLKLSGKNLAKAIGYVPQSVPMSNMTVFDSVLIGRKPHIEWTTTDRDIDKVSAVIETLGMEKLSLRFLNEISGGEFQKVQIARAIVQEPKVLILDEPTNNLDISNQHTTMHMIENIVRSRGMCTIMTMHDINLAVHYSDKFLFLKDGEVAAYGGLEVINEDLIEDVYGVECDVIDHRGVPFVVPRESSKYHCHKDFGHTHDVHDHLLKGDSLF